MRTTRWIGWGLVGTTAATIAVLGCAKHHDNAAGLYARTIDSSTVGAVHGAAAHTAPAGSLPSLDEEVWVIVQPDEVAPNVTDDEIPGFGAMMCILPTHPDVQVALPLDHTDVDGSISAYIASVNVKQSFYDPYDDKIEAIYVFPLPQNAAVNGFVMTVGERKIRGIIREREEAEQIYRAARSQGYVASLLTQERANIFTQHVANIEPGKRIDVDITYFNTLAYDDGWYEFVSPMVVGPRFNPPATRGGIGAVARGHTGASGHAVEVQYLRPGERSGHDISLDLDITVGVTVEEIKCRSHEIVVTGADSSTVHVTLADENVVPDRR